MAFKKNILLCVTGGIAGYKAAALTSKLVQAGFDVKVIMTESARQFVTPLTFQVLSRNEVYFDTFDEKNAEVIAHIDLADWADLVLVAPATANMIGKLASGIADDMVTTTLLATTAPVWIAPAMNVHMYEHPAVKRNIEILYRDGYRFIEPQEGRLACGYVGKGRLEEPETIIELLKKYFNEQPPHVFKNKTILITAGPTREKVDPVRFFSNHSSGKMGFAIAEQAVLRGARVILISGPTALTPPKDVTFVPVESSEDMYQAVFQYFDEADIVIKAAAVSDYKPKKTYDQKLKKTGDSMTIEMERTVDILKTLGERKGDKLLIGFAAETNNVEQYAMKKLSEKNLDFIVANNVSEEGAGFQTDTNIVTIYKRNGEKASYPLMPKKEVADVILTEIEKTMKGE